MMSTRLRSATSGSQVFSNVSISRCSLVIVNAVGMQLVKQLTRHVQILQSSPNQIEHPKLMRRTHGSHSSGMFVEGAAATRDEVPEVPSTGSGINR